MSRPSKNSARPASLLTRILSTPALTEELQRLPAAALLRLIDNVGIEDSSQILALATTPQLTRMLDEDLWRQPITGGTEELDVSRLAVWLAALAELGPQAAATKLAELDEEFLCFALSQFLHALEMEALQFLLVDTPFDNWHDDRLEKFLETAESQELGRVVVLAKEGAPWEIILPILLALDDLDQRLCSSLLHKLCAATEAKAEAEGGLYEVLSAEEKLTTDATFSREERRARDGYLSTADAKAFMAWLQLQSDQELLSALSCDPVSCAYFRSYEGAPLVSKENANIAGTAAPLLALLGENGKEAVLRLDEHQEAGALTRLLDRMNPESRSRFHAELNFLVQALMLTEKEAGGHGPMRAADATMHVLERVKKGINKAGPPGLRLSAIALYGLGAKITG